MNTLEVMEEANDTSVFSMNRWREMNVTVFGMGRSGQAAADLLLDKGSKVTLIEEQARPAFDAIAETYEQRGVRVCIGGNLESALSHAELIVLSPGVSKNHHIVQQACQRKIPVIGEIELAAKFLQAPIIAVTGTNGKSTTVRLIGSILQQSGKHVFVGGNLGLPLCEAVTRSTDSSKAKAYDYVVAEVSSFQLETIEQFKPWISVLLNVTPDHLDRHSTQEEYRAAKQRIFENQTDRDWMVINADDPVVAEMADSSLARLCEFSLYRDVRQGVFLQRDMIHTRFQGSEDLDIDREDISVRGQHNVANAMAAMSVGLLCGCTKENVVKALQDVPTFEHALESVRTWQGIRFVNDSKGTNVDATLKALQSFEEPVVLILGGKDKGGDFTLLLRAIQRGVKGLVAIGEAAPRILRELGEYVSISHATSLEDAVSQAIALASRGDVVLLSPACSSFDMFQNYHQRGLEFKRIVGELS